MGKSFFVAAVVGMAVLIGHAECFRSGANLGLRAVGNGRLCPQLRRSVGVFQNLKSQVRSLAFCFHPINMNQKYRINSDFLHNWHRLSPIRTKVGRRTTRKLLRNPPLGPPQEMWIPPTTSKKTERLSDRFKCSDSYVHLAAFYLPDLISWLRLRT